MVIKIQGLHILSQDLFQGKRRQILTLSLRCNVKLIDFQMLANT